MARGNLEGTKLRYALHRSRCGDPSHMPDALLGIAQSLRRGDSLLPEEAEFLAAALEQTATSEKPAVEIANAFGLSRRKGRTQAEKFDRAYPRAMRASELIEGGLTHEAAFTATAAEFHCDESRISEAYYDLRDYLRD